MTDFVIPRPRYMAQLKTGSSSRLIKVVMGPRRCGKSFLLHLYREELKASGVADEQMLVYDLARLANLKFCDPVALNDDILKRRAPGEKTYLFIDAVEECRGFERLLAGLAEVPGLDIYVTGSNAYMLSGELGTSLAGCCIPIEMLPLSFAEFRGAVAEDGLSADEDFMRYLRVGSYPAQVPFRGNDFALEHHYELLIESMVYKDAAQRLKLKDPMPLKRLISALATQIGSQVSARRIANTLRSVEGQREMSDVTAGRYLNVLVECYMFLPGKRFDVRGNAALASGEKYYLADPGMRDRLAGTSVRDLGHMLENAVFLELKRRHQQVWVGKVDETEIDFVCRDGEKTSYYQVAASVLAEDTLTRELRPFEKLRDRSPCHLLTLDRIGAGRVIDGVAIENAVDWFLDTSR